MVWVWMNEWIYNFKNQKQVKFWLGEYVEGSIKISHFTYTNLGMRFGSRGASLFGNNLQASNEMHFLLYILETYLSIIFLDFNSMNVGFVLNTCEGLYIGSYPLHHAT